MIFDFENMQINCDESVFLLKRLYVKDSLNWKWFWEFGRHEWREYKDIYDNVRLDM